MTTHPSPPTKPAYVMPSTIGQLRALFGRLPEDLLVATSYHEKKGDYWPTECWTPDRLDEAATWCTRQARTHNVYVRCTALAEKPAKGRRGSSDLTGALVAAWADLDIAGPGHKKAASGLPHPPNVPAVLSVLRDLGLPPTMTIHTGGGLHAWWLLQEPWVFTGAEDRTVAERFTTRWGEGIQERFRLRGWHCDAVGDLPRVLRVCGTWRYKPNVTPNRVTLHSCGEWPPGLVDNPDWRPGPLYTVADLEAVIIEPAAPEAPPRPPAPPGLTDAKTLTMGRPKYDNSYGPATAVGEAMSWAQIFEPAGWTFTNWGRIDGQAVELWLRPGDASSAYSVKAFPDGPCVNWSDASGLPVGKGKRLSKWRVLVALHFRGDERQAASDIRRLARSRAS